MKKMIIALLTTCSIYQLSISQPPCTAHLVSTVGTGGLFPFNVAVSPTGRCLAVTNNNSNTVSIFRICKGGCRVTSSPIQITNTGTNPEGVSFSPSGSCLVVANAGSNTLSVFSVNKDCTLTLTQVIASGGIAPNGLTFSPRGNCFAVNNQVSCTISVFSLTSKKCHKKCVCSAELIQSVNSGGTNPARVVYSPDGSCAVVPNSDSQNLALFSVDPTTCQFTQTGSVPVDASPKGADFSPDGTCFATTNLNPGQINLYTVSGCSLTLHQTIPNTGGNAVSIKFSQNGKCLMWPNISLNTISIFQIANCTGEFAQSLPGSSPDNIQLMPCKKCFVVTNTATNTLSLFKFNCN